MSRVEKSKVKTIYKSGGNIHRLFTGGVEQEKLVNRMSRRQAKKYFAEERGAKYS